MAQNNSTTNKRTFKHLTPFQRGRIASLHEEGKAQQAIADSLGIHKSTVSRELKRGTTTQRKGRTSYQIYIPETGQAVYEKNRKACGCKLKLNKAIGFIEYAEERILNDKWSPDAIVGRVRELDEFVGSHVCAKTLYNYIDKGLLEVRNIHLAMKVSRKTKPSKVRKNKKHFGNSIEERPLSINQREEFGHWEIDTVMGLKSHDNALLTLTERKTRNNLVFRLSAKDDPSVTEAIKGLQERLGDKFSQVFKSITSDNGSEFSNLTEAIGSARTAVYYTHPYSSFERGTNERHNGLIRRFIHKGTPIHSLSDKFIIKVVTWCNNLPRKILGYRTPQEIFLEELKQLTHARSTPA